MANPSGQSRNKGSTHRRLLKSRAHALTMRWVRHVSYLPCLVFEPRISVRCQAETVLRMTYANATRSMKPTFVPCIAGSPDGHSHYVESSRMASPEAALNSPARLPAISGMAGHELSGVHSLSPVLGQRCQLTIPSVVPIGALVPWFAQVVASALCCLS